MAKTITRRPPARPSPARLATEFILRFPVGTWIPIDELDAFFEEFGYRTEIDTNKRARCVNAIRDVVLSERWKTSGYPPAFWLLCHTPGLLYRVAPIEEGHAKMVADRPDEIERDMLSKRRRREALAAAGDLDAYWRMNPAEQAMYDYNLALVERMEGDFLPIAHQLANLIRRPERHETVM